MLLLESADAGRRAFDAFSRSSRKTSDLLASASTCFFAIAYFASPKNARHPYLLYAASAGPLALVYSLVVLQPLKHRILTATNGEHIRRDIDSWRLVNGGRAVLFLAAFGISLVGLFGDWQK
jgi:hypothetical protein